MLYQSTCFHIELGVNEAVSLRHVENSELFCQSGDVWITEENSEKDIVLSAGQSHRLTRAGRTVVQSLGPSDGAQCRVQLPRSSHSVATRLRRWLPEVGRSKAGFRLVSGA
jgi:hypothetical protein